MSIDKDLYTNHAARTDACKIDQQLETAASVAPNYRGQLVSPMSAYTVAYL